MIILSIETSCDETAVSLVEALGDFPNAKYEVLGNAVFSQIEMHREYGGVFPTIAKREHSATLVPMLKKAIAEASLKAEYRPKMTDEQKIHLQKILEREPSLANQLIGLMDETELPAIGLIAVTAGPGLVPALWVGVNFAKALAYALNIPVVPVNHMEGHILASVFDGHKIDNIEFPALAILISGGHTELVKLNHWQDYQKIGETRDDAIGEAFDKVARMLGLPYPGGPEISKLAQEARQQGIKTENKLPRPMLNSGDFDFSFSGLKTAVLYRVKDRDLTQEEKMAMAREFEDTVTEVMIKKTASAVNQHQIQSLIIGGGVIANKHLRQSYIDHFRASHPDLKIYLPDLKLATDNSIMIALAGHSYKDRAVSGSDVQNIQASSLRFLAE